MNWVLTVWAELREQGICLFHVVRGGSANGPSWLRWLPAFSFLGAAVMVSVGLVFSARAPASRYLPPPDPALSAFAPEALDPIEIVDVTQPVRETPHRFPARSRMPAAGEGDTSLSIHHVSFDPERDLVFVRDERVWWESDNDQGDTEDDHLVHAALEIPLRRLIELVVAEGGILEVQDAYRAEGIHSPRSLHKQGRAVDLTCDELGLERLAALAWAAGFDWVYYEAPKDGGHHVHASVRP